MEDKTLDQLLDELSAIPEERIFSSGIVSEKSVDHLIAAHELKYIEKVLEVTEEANLVKINLDDFEEYPDEVKFAAFKAYEHAKRDPEYFAKPEADQGLFKPVMILSNIDAKKNEVKIKGWQVDYHARLIEKLRDYKAVSAFHKDGYSNPILALLKKLKRK